MGPRALQEISADPHTVLRRLVQSDAASANLAAFKRDNGICLLTMRLCVTAVDANAAVVQSDAYVPDLACETRCFPL